MLSVIGMECSWTFLTRYMKRKSFRTHINIWCLNVCEVFLLTTSWKQMQLPANCYRLSANQHQYYDTHKKEQLHTRNGSVFSVYSTTESSSPIALFLSSIALSSLCQLAWGCCTRPGAHSRPIEKCLDASFFYCSREASIPFPGTVLESRYFWFSRVNS